MGQDLSETSPFAAETDRSMAHTDTSPGGSDGEPARWAAEEAGEGAAVQRRQRSARLE